MRFHKTDHFSVTLSTDFHTYFKKSKQNHLDKCQDFNWH